MRLVLLCALAAVMVGQAPMGVQELSFFYGREYFVLRSGRVQMVVQSDRADVGAGFTWLVFDAEESRHTLRKRNAWNFSDSEAHVSSALQVVLGQHPFTALGHHLETRWTEWMGIPAVEAVWWAGGVRVTERVAAYRNGGIFRRTIQLEGTGLAGEDVVSLRLRLPGECREEGRILACVHKEATLRVAAVGDLPSVMRAGEGVVEIGPLPVGPKQKTIVETQLAVMPPGLAGSDESSEQETASLWAMTSRVKTGDAVVQEVFDRARYGLHGMVAADGTMNAGIFEYGAQWVRDTSNTALGALHAGHFDLARAAILRILTRMINIEGNAMIASAFESPDKEQFDQMGELLHLLRSWRDWTGDESLIREHREKLLALIERPLRPEFRGTGGMVHNRREFWERTLDDGYELAYQTYVILGLREAAELADALEAPERAMYWRDQSAQMLASMLAPATGLVEQGRLIKRRGISGEETVSFPGSFRKENVRRRDTPAAAERTSRLTPDAASALPIALGIVDAASPIARQTLEELEGLWNLRWTTGGYERYHSSSQLDQPGPWTLATAFLMRAQHEARMYERSRRSLEWMHSNAGGRTGAWFEQVPLNRGQMAYSGILPWSSGEMALFVVRHYLGVDFEKGALRIRPALYPGAGPVEADLRFRSNRLIVSVNGSGRVKQAIVNGVRVTAGKDGAVRLPRDFAGGTVAVWCDGKPWK